MKTPYQLTDADYALLSDIAGGFNYNRVGVPWSERFAASVKWANADGLNELCARANPEDAHQPAPGPGGSVPVDAGPSLPAGGSNPVPVHFAPGRAQALRAPMAGNASASLQEAGAGLYGAVLASIPDQIAIADFTTWGAKAIQGLPIQPGQFLVVYSEAAHAVDGDADIRTA